MVDFPEPLGPSRAMNSPCPQFEDDVVEHQDRLSSRRRTWSRARGEQDLSCRVPSAPIVAMRVRSPSQSRRKSSLGQPIEPPPEQPLMRTTVSAITRVAASSNGKFPLFGGGRDRRTEPYRRVGRATEGDVFRDDARVPGATGRGDHAGDQIGKMPGRMSSRQRCQLRGGRRSRPPQIGRNRQRTGDDVEQQVPLGAEEHQRDGGEVEPARERRAGSAAAPGRAPWPEWTRPPEPAAERASTSVDSGRSPRPPAPSRRRRIERDHGTQEGGHRRGRQAPPFARGRAGRASPAPTDRRRRGRRPGTASTSTRERDPAKPRGRPRPE